MPIFPTTFDYKKGRIYKDNWGDCELKTVDVKTLTTIDIPGNAQLAWASFPCQDLSLAGAGAGLKGDSSGTFWPFWQLMKGLIAEDRAPQLIVLENVCGTLNSHNGNDFAAICDAVEEAGYSAGALVIDASLFLPQSRPRLFMICPRKDVKVPMALVAGGPGRSLAYFSPSLGFLGDSRQKPFGGNWIWWSLPVPAKRQKSLADLIEKNPKDVAWFSDEETENLISMMSDLNREKLAEAKRKNRQIVGGLYRRTRSDEFGRKVQRAEIRFDDISGCLRTPAGGSSRQVIMIVKGESVRARLISGRETARLMGLPDTYRLPGNYTETYHLTGDGVAVPVVRHLAANIFEPIVDAASSGTTIAA